MLIDISMAIAAVPAAPVPANTVLTGPMLTSTALLGGHTSGATSARMRPSIGAMLRCGRCTWLPSDAQLGGQSALPAGQQVRGEAALFGSGNHAAGLAQFATQQRTSKKYLHSTKMYARPTTRLTVIGGGAQGPPPARDPV